MLGIMMDNADNITLKMVGAVFGTIEGTKINVEFDFYYSSLGPFKITSSSGDNNFSTLKL